MTVLGAALAGTGGVAAPLWTSCKTRQLEALQEILARRAKDDPALGEITASSECSVSRTSTERGIARVEHPNLAAALDVLNAYQSKRRARSSAHFGGYRFNLRRQYRDDPRTWLTEVLKQWLRTNAANADLAEVQVRNVVGLCRDVIACQALFPARNQQSFIHTIAEVYKRLQQQLREVLKRTRTCSELAHGAITLSRNLVSDSIAYLLVAATDLKQTDKLPSLETVALWESLPAAGNPLPASADVQLQRAMQNAWSTHCGQLVAALLGSPWCVRLFGADATRAGSSSSRQEALTLQLSNGGAREGDSANSAAAAVPALIEVTRQAFEQGHFRASGLAGAFRQADAMDVRQTYLAAVELVFDLTYLLGEALVQFSRISDGLGDYGMIRAAPWLHPFLEALIEKVQKLKKHFEKLNEDIDRRTVLKKARGESVEKPAPTDNMSFRAQGAINRAVKSGESHANALLKTLQELRNQSAPERLPELQESLNDVVLHLDFILSSPDFRARVGDNFPELPALLTSAGGGPSGGGSSAAALGGPLCGTALTDAPAPCIVDVSDHGEAFDAPEASGAAARSSAMKPQLSLLSQESTADTLAIEEDLGGSAGSVNPPSDRAAHRTVPAATASSFWQVDCQPEVMLEPPGADAPRSGHAPVGGRAARRSSSAPSGRSGCSSVGAAASTDLFMQVTRLTGPYPGFGWRRHDRRALRLHGRTLDVFERGSTTRVKTEVDVAASVDSCERVGERAVRLELRRAPKGFSGEGVEEHKAYVFEFPSASYAAEFLDALLRCRHDAQAGRSQVSGARISRLASR